MSSLPAAVQQLSGHMRYENCLAHLRLRHEIRGLGAPLDRSRVLC